MSIFRSLAMGVVVSGSLALAVFACGKIPDADDGSDDGTDGMNGDAGTPDAGPPATGPATIKVFDNDGNPAAGLNVVHTRPDGTAADEGPPPTDAAGESTFEVTAGDVVHVAIEATEAGTNRVRLFTIVGIEPGDVVPINPPRQSGPGSTPLGNLNLMAPSVTGATQYEMSIGCSSTSGASPSLSLTVFSDCVVDGKVFVVAWAFDASGQMLKGAVIGTVNAPQPGINTTATVSAWGDPTQRDLTISGLPPGTITVNGQIETFVGPGRFERFEQEALGTGSAQVFRIKMVRPMTPAYPTHAAIQGGFGFLGTGAGGAEVIDGMIVKVKKSQALAGETAPNLDMTARPPRFHEAAFTPATRTFTWMTTGSAENLEYQRQSDFMMFFVGFQTGTTDVFWQILAPPDTTSPISFDLHGLNGFIGPDTTARPFPLLLIETPQIDGYWSVKSDYGTGVFEGLFDGKDEYEATGAFTGSGLD